MALYRVLFSGFAGGLVAYAALATVAGTASFLTPTAIARGIHDTVPVVAGIEFGVAGVDLAYRIVFDGEHRGARPSMGWVDRIAHR